MNDNINVHNILDKLGCFGICSPDWYRSHIESWYGFYRGKTKFHNYRVYNGKQFVNCERKSLEMAKKVCEDKADLLLNEKVTITTQEQEFIDEVLDYNNFWVNGNQLIEITNALGTGACVEYLNGENICIDYIPALYIFPLSCDNGEITECAFASVRYDKDIGQTLYVNRHLIENGRYVVYNNLFDKNGRDIPLPESVMNRWDTKREEPLFQIITPNIKNNISINNPMGISIFANSIDVLKSIDVIYDSYQNEFVLGKKRIFVGGRATTIDIESGTPQPRFDPNELVFHALPGLEGAEEKGDLIKEINMTLRVAEHQTALQSNLDILSEKVGFGKGYYKFDVDNVQTATAVVSQNSKLYRKIRKDEIVLEKALIDMVRAILYLGGKIPDAEISVNFDDSIIEDTEAIAKRAMLEYSAGIIDQVEYFMRVYNLEESAAKRKVADIQRRLPGVEAEPQREDFFVGVDEA